MHVPAPIGVSSPGEVEDALPLDHVDDLVVGVAVHAARGRRDEPDELGDVGAAEVLVDEKPELAVRPRRQRGPVGVAHRDAVSSSARSSCGRRTETSTRSSGPGFRSRTVAGTRKAPVSGSSACRAPFTRSVPLPAGDVEELLPVAVSRSSTGRARSGHPLLEPLAPAGRVDRDADRGGVALARSAPRDAFVDHIAGHRGESAIVCGARRERPARPLRAPGRPRALRPGAAGVVDVPHLLDDPRPRRGGR